MVCNDTFVVFRGDFEIFMKFFLPMDSEFLIIPCFHFLAFRIFAFQLLLFKFSSAIATVSYLLNMIVDDN